MDEQLLKKTVQSIEMPNDMKERIIENCRSGEAQPLILPKKRFVFMPAAAACLCVLAVALTGVGIWQASVLGDGGSDISILPNESGTGYTVINDIGDPVDLVQAGGQLTLDKLLEICSGDPSTLGWKDFEQYKAREIGSGLYILQYDIEDKYTLLIGGVPENEPGYMIFSLIGAEDGIDIREGGLEEYLAAHPAKEQLTLDKLLEICSGDCSKLSWKDFEQFECHETGESIITRVYDIEGKGLLYISGEPVYRTPYCMDFGFVGVEDCIDIRDGGLRNYLASQSVREPLTLDKLKEICKDNASELVWGDFEQYAYTQTGTSYIIRRYDIDGLYVLDISGALDQAPENMYFSFNYAAQSSRMDIRMQDIDTYLSYYQDRINQIHESGEKESAFAYLELYENIYEKAWHEYNAIPFGENHLPALQAIEAAEPDARMAAIAYAAIGMGKTLPKAPVPDTVNIIPVSESAAAANWTSSIYMYSSGFSVQSISEDLQNKSASSLQNYFGTKVLPDVPNYMELQYGGYGVYSDESGEVYLDVNVIRYASNEYFNVYRDGAYVNLTLTVEVMKNGIPDFSPEFWKNASLLSDINGVTVAIGQVSEYDYAAEFMVGDVGFHITSNLSLEKLTEVISSLTANS